MLRAECHCSDISLVTPQWNKSGGAVREQQAVREKLQDSSTLQMQSTVPGLGAYQQWPADGSIVPWVVRSTPELSCRPSRMCDTRYHHGWYPTPDGQRSDPANVLTDNAQQPGRSVPLWAHPQDRHQSGGCYVHLSHREILVGMAGPHILSCPDFRLCLPRMKLSKQEYALPVPR